MDLLLKFQVLPFSTLTTEILQVLVEKLRRGRHTKARNGSTQAAFLLFPYCFQWWTDDYCVSQAPSRKQKAPSTGNRLVSLRAEGVEDGLPWNAATGRGNRHQRLSSPSELSQWLLKVRLTWRPEGKAADRASWENRAGNGWEIARKKLTSATTF